MTGYIWVYIHIISYNVLLPMSCAKVGKSLVLAYLSFNRPTGILEIGNDHFFNG